MIKKIFLMVFLFCVIFFCKSSSAYGPRLINRLKESKDDLIERNKYEKVLITLDANNFYNMSELDYGSYIRDKFKVEQENFEEFYFDYFNADRNLLVYTRVEEFLILAESKKPVLIIIENLLAFDGIILTNKCLDLDKKYFFKFFNFLCKRKMNYNDFPWEVFYN